MMLAFFLGMPGCPSWNGRWSGEGRKYVIIKTFRSKKDIEKAKQILNQRYFTYKWSDGWMASITVKEVDSQEANRLRKSSNGFHGYDWMVDTICLYGQPMATHEVKDYISNK